MDSCYFVIEISEINKMSQQRMGGHIKDLLQMKVHLLMYITISRKHVACSRALWGYLEEDNFHTNVGDSPFLSKTHQIFTTEPYLVHPQIIISPGWMSHLGYQVFRFVHDTTELSGDSSVCYLMLTMFKAFTAGRVDVVILYFYSLPSFHLDH